MRTKKEIIDSYEENYQKIEVATKKIIELTKALINSEDIQTHAIYGRAKSIKSYSEKAKRYDRPDLEITDYIGIRIITYVQTDVDKVCKSIEKEFQIDEKNCVNKNVELGIDKIGYRSIHYIAKLKSSRAELTEYKEIARCSFEIQVRTLLQHAWAEIEHDRRYKFSGVLPSGIQRKFNLVSAILEVADNEFNAIAAEIDNYDQNVEKLIKNRNYDTEINSSTLRAYIKQNDLLNHNSNDWERLYRDNDEIIIKELSDFGIRKLNDLQKIENSAYFKELAQLDFEDQTFLGILRDLMIINDIDKYFKKSWKHHWNGIDSPTYELFINLGIPIDEYIVRYDLNRDFDLDENDESF